MANSKHILFATVIALSACASAPPPAPVPDAQPHQTPDDPNPEALQQGVIEWMEAVCAIEDPAEREKALKEGAERGWNAACPDPKTQGVG